MAHRRLFVLLGLALTLSACALWPTEKDGRSDRADWTVSRSEDETVELAHPADWKLQEAGAGKLSLAAPDGCRLFLVLSSRPRPEGFNQAEVLDNMQSAAELSCFRDGLEFEAVGRRVWMGEELIWHEVHYRGTPRASCDDCTARYSIEMLSFPQESGRLSASYVCPGVDPLDPDQEQLLLDILNTLVLSRVDSV